MIKKRESGTVCKLKKLAHHNKKKRESSMYASQKRATCAS